MAIASLRAAGRDLVLFDTDSGIFGDDGAALTMLLRSPSKVTVQAITVTPGNVWTAQGAEYMLHILDVLKRTQIPVAMGAEAPLLHTVGMAKEFDRRWGGLAYMGAFGIDPTAVLPAPDAQRKPAG